MTSLEIVKFDALNKTQSLWNASIEVNGNYASNYPYTVIDENLVQRLLNHSEEYIPQCDVTPESFVTVEFETLLNILYPTILLVASTGNIIVCFIVLSSSRMKTVTNYFITNLGEWAALCCCWQPWPFRC